MPITDFQTLRLFLSVHELRNVTRAAERHHIATSAVTKRIKELETTHNVRLFDRQARGVIPTIAGDELANHVRSIMLMIDRATASMSEFSLGAKGHVRIAATASSILGGLSDHIGAFTKKHPNVICDITEDTSLANISSVMSGRVDLAVVAMTEAIPADLTIVTVASDTLCVITTPDDPLADKKEVAFADLLSRDQIGIGATSALAVQLNQVALQQGLQIEYRYRVSTCDVARAMVSSGLGIAILPDSMVGAYGLAQNLKAIPLSDPWAKREMIMCYREESQTVASRLFIEHVTREAFPDGEG